MKCQTIVIISKFLAPFSPFKGAEKESEIGSKHSKILLFSSFIIWRLNFLFLLGSGRERKHCEIRSEKSHCIESIQTEAIS